MGIVDELTGIAADAWNADKSDFQRQVEQLTGADSEEKPADYHRIFLIGRVGAYRCKLCGRDDHWTLEGGDNPGNDHPVFVCEWDCEEHQPIGSGRLGLRQVDSVPAHRVNYSERVGLE